MLIFAERGGGTRVAKAAADDAYYLAAPCGSLAIRRGYLFGLEKAAGVLRASRSCVFSYYRRVVAWGRYVFSYH